MRNRAFRIFLLAVIAVWFGVVVPLHPRGVIKLGGAAARSCCHPGKATPKDSKPNPSECAVCHFVGTLDLPPAMGMDIPPLGLVDEIMPLAPAAAPWIEWGTPSVERAPPIA